MTHSHSNTTILYIYTYMRNYFLYKVDEGLWCGVMLFVTWIRFSLGPVVTRWFQLIHNAKLSTLAKTARFPHSKPNLLRQWISNMHRANFMPSTKAVVCSDHFEESCFDKTGQTVRLRPGSIPTLFKLPQHLMKKSKVRKPPKECHISSTSNQCDTSEPQLPCPVGLLAEVPSVPMIDHSYIIRDSPRSIKRKLEDVIHQAECVKKKLKYSNAKIRRLKLQVKSLTDIVINLKNKNMSSSDCEAILSGAFSGASLELRIK